jgi:hypothetical protein
MANGGNAATRRQRQWWEEREGGGEVTVDSRWRAFAGATSWPERVCARRRGRTVTVRMAAGPPHPCAATIAGLPSVTHARPHHRGVPHPPRPSPPPSNSANPRIRLPAPSPTFEQFWARIRVGESGLGARRVAGRCVCPVHAPLARLARWCPSRRDGQGFWLDAARGVCGGCGWLAGSDFRLSRVAIERM